MTGQRERTFAPSKNAVKGPQEAWRDRLPENIGFVVQSTVRKICKKKKCSAQSNGVNTYREQNTFMMQFLQKVNNKSECND